LREDKPARSVEHEWPPTAGTVASVPPPFSETPMATKAPTSSRPARVTHGERVIDASTGTTKLDLYRHYDAVAALMLSHVKQRPVALLRAPKGIDGQTFFQKHLS